MYDPVDPTATEFASIIGWNGTLTDIEDRTKCAFPVAGKLKNFYVRLNQAPGAGKSFTFTIRKNGADTALVVTISGTDTVGQNTTNEIEIAVGDLVNIKIAPTNTPTGAYVAFGLEFERSR